MIGRVLASTLLAGFISTATCASAFAQQITMATWGGGVGKAWREAVAQPFTAETGIKVNIVEVPTPEAQIRAQASAPQFNAAISSLFEAANMYADGLLEDFDPAEFPALQKVPEEYLLKNDKGRVIGVSVYFAYYGIAVNTSVANAAEFSSWKSLADPKWKGQLSVTRPIYSSAYDLTIMSVAAGDEENKIDRGLEIVKGLGQNSLAMYSSMAQMNQLLQRGEVAAAPYYSTRVWQMRREGQDELEMVIPQEGALMLPYIVVVPKGAQDRDSYMKWLNYAAEAKAQVQIADIAGYFPLNSDAKLSAEAEAELGQPLPDLIGKLYQPDWNVVAQNHKERLQLVEQSMAAQ